ncbi:MAG: argininosuccinate synthase [Proteobacteria bacterium]|jgi:argininosuccinate synthase|nr:argininosuccinate synthase [Pseudomonadota bacterium]NCX24899.1 argininosuccinate synthase [Pseudomonadota bacterium]NCX34423.1 argininosuccinate synthase [Pseudomonadota bacterium]
MKKIVLAFSGGLDTSFCVPYLIDQGFEVHTIFVNSGGTPLNEEKKISKRAYELGAKKHINVNIETNLWSQIVKPLIWSGSLYQDKYPALCSDRYLIVSEAIKLCKKLNTKYISHGCTGMGNDQVRFDLSIQAFGNYKTITPIREIQNKVKDVRGYEQEYLKKKGFKVSSLHSKYSINENLMGATVSGSEIDEWKEPSKESYILCNTPDKYPSNTKKVEIEFSKGEAKKINGKLIKGPDLLRMLNKIGGKYGIGRELFAGDTIIGIKGRFLFESPGISILQRAHRALEESIFTDKQNAFKPLVGKRWVELIYGGFYFDPLRKNLENFLEDIQKPVNGKVTVLLSPGKVEAVSVEAKKILISNDAIYAQSASWGVEESSGFIKLLGKSTSTWTEINK